MNTQVELAQKLIAGNNRRCPQCGSQDYNLEMENEIECPLSKNLGMIEHQLGHHRWFRFKCKRCGFFCELEETYPHGLTEENDTIIQRITRCDFH